MSLPGARTATEPETTTQVPASARQPPQASAAAVQRGCRWELAECWWPWTATHGIRERRTHTAYSGSPGHGVGRCSARGSSQPIERRKYSATSRTWNPSSVASQPRIALVGKHRLENVHERRAGPQHPGHLVEDPRGRTR